MYCRRCGAPLHEGIVICPECGSRQRRRFSAVRCAACGGRVALGLSMCPHCGRNLRPAGPRWGLWLAGAAILALVALWGVGELPVDRLLNQAITAKKKIASVVQVLGPAASSLIEAGAGGATPASVARTTVESSAEPVVVEADSQGLLTEEETSEEEMETAPIVEPVATSALTAPVTPEATPSTGTIIAKSTLAEATGMPTMAATAAGDTPTPRSTSAPSPTPIPPSPTPTALPPTAPPTATATSAPASGTQTYQVRSGDTLSSIASRFDITWQQLAAANGLTSRSVLRIGQSLVIPVPGATQSQGATPTSTPKPRQAVPTAPPPTPAITLDAPILTSPGDQTPISGLRSFELVWNPSKGMPVGAQYQVTVHWLDQEGQQQQYWWLTPGTSTLVPTGLYAQAAQPARKYNWFVTAVLVTTDGKGGEKVIPLSPPSNSRVFYWN